MKKRFVSASAALLLAVSVITGPVAAQSSRTAAVSHAAVVELSRIAIDNFGQVNETFYRGAQPTGTDYLALAALGVKTVIDLQADGQPNEESLVRAAGMRFHRIPMTTRVAPTETQVDEFLALVNDPAAQPVYLHCAGGRHRTGVMTAVYRMTADGWTADQAFAEMKRYKFGLDFLHPEFKRFVYTFEGQQQQQRAAATVRAAG